MELFEALLADAQPNPAVLENMKADIQKSRTNAKLNQSSNFSKLLQYAYYGPKSPARNILSAAELKQLKPKDLIKQLHRFAHILVQSRQADIYSLAARRNIIITSQIIKLLFNLFRRHFAGAQIIQILHSRPQSLVLVRAQ